MRKKPSKLPQQFPLLLWRHFLHKDVSWIVHVLLSLWFLSSHSPSSSFLAQASVPFAKFQIVFHIIQVVHIENWGNNAPKNPWFSLSDQAQIILSLIEI